MMILRSTRSDSCFFTDSFNLNVHLLKPAPNDRNWHKTEIAKQKLTLCSLSEGTIENVCQQSTLREKWYFEGHKSAMSVNRTLVH